MQYNIHKSMCSESLVAECLVAIPMCFKEYHGITIVHVQKARV